MKDPASDAPETGRTTAGSPIRGTEATGPGASPADLPLPPEALPENLIWFCRLRWIAVAGVLLAIAAAVPFHLVESASGLALAVGLLVFHNILLGATIRRWPGRRLVLATRASMVADLAVLTLFIHLAGGLENPFAAFYLFHVVIAGVVLGRRETFLCAGLAVLLYGALAALETAGWLPHWHLGTRAPHAPGAGPWSPLEAAGAVGAVTISAFAMAYFINRLMARLRAHAARERHLQAQLVRRNRMLLMGELASGVFHEINSPLDAAQSAVDVLRRETGTSADAGRTLGLMNEALSRISRMARRLLSLTQPRREQFRAVDVNQIVRDTIPFVEHRVRAEQVALETDLAESLPPVQGDPDALSEVLLNLLTNALDAVPRSTGRILVSTSTDRDGPRAEVAVTVSDNGPGFDPASRDRLFSPFFTTKPGGTGLGLPIAQKIAEEHGGLLDAQTGSHGATFAILLPAMVGEARP